MIPAVIHQQDVLPRSGNGKVDRKRIKALFADAPAHAAGSAAPDDAYSGFFAQVKALWCENLGLPDAAPEDNYYLSGGDSLKAIRLASAINKAFDITLKSADVLDLQELGQIAECAHALMLCA